MWSTLFFRADYSVLCKRDFETLHKGNISIHNTRIIPILSSVYGARTGTFAKSAVGRYPHRPMEWRKWGVSRSLRQSKMGISTALCPVHGCVSPIKSASCDRNKDLHDSSRARDRSPLTTDVYTSQHQPTAILFRQACRTALHTTMLHDPGERQCSGVWF
jgi:hypothetical protein